MANARSRALAASAVLGVRALAGCVDGVTPDCSSGQCGPVVAPPDAGRDAPAPAADAASDAAPADAKTDG